ncbi:HNH endonuclease [Pectobacterium phage Peat1]|uniref:HNH endonuclease n=1 Tax=Pectobacterium phage Peat1 TaxID=1654601 RepID=A0A0H3YJ81_9CAUD|nr:HNH endonuclease [Pectobacterium phage Peat1]AKN21197.1 HNH endonuclease [Pectobacterium phage Peat1]
MELLREYLAVSTTSCTGLVWIKSPRAAIKIGTPAFIRQDKDGYFCGLFKRKPYRAHRVVFFLTHNYWPAQVDHIDGAVTNNNPSNLRAVTVSENNHNIIAAGYTQNKITGRYQAKIMVHGKRKYLGYFNTPEEARTAYLTAKKQLHPTAPARCY